MFVKTFSCRDCLLPLCCGSSSAGIDENQALETILIVDDDINFAKSARILLQYFCCEIVTRTTGEEALHYLNKFSNRVVLVLLDINLPSISGFDVLSKIKQSDHLKDTPVILQTAETAIDKEECLELGAAGFVQKPYSKAELYDSIRKIDIVKSFSNLQFSDDS